MEFIKTPMRILLRRRNVVIKQIMNKVQSINVDEESLTKQKPWSKNILNYAKRNEKQLLEITLSPLLETNNPSDDLFLNIRNDIINKHSIPEKSVDLKILDICIQNKKFQLAKSYFAYLKSKNYPLNNFILIKYLQLLSTEEIPLPNSIEEDIINICDKIQKDYECLPAQILSTCVHALCMTRKWETTFDLVKVNGTIEDITSNILSYMTMAAFRNGKPKIGFELLEEIETVNELCINGRKIMYDVYLNYYLLNEKKGLNNAIHKMFFFWKRHSVVPIISVINKFVDVCKESGWEGHHVKISNDGQCSHCQKYLSSMNSNKNFIALSKAVISDIIIGEDIFQKTSPIELNRFKIFIRKLKPFDIVIDGLNVSYVTSKTPWLQLIIKKFTEEGKKILVVTRQHQYKLSKWMFNQDNVHIYFLKDITQDDPFILYATLCSGNNAKFVSIDQMRQHYYKLKKFNLHKDFILWQLNHQYTWYYDNISNNNVLIEPISYYPYAQVENKHWHIPYKESMKSLHKSTQTWVCLRPPNI